MDGGWDLNDLYGVEWGIIRGINLALNKDRALDVVDLSLGLDNGGIDSVGSLEDSWDSNGKMRGGWLVDLGGGGVGSRGSRLSISYRGVGDNRASRVVLSSISNGGSSSCNWSNSSNRGCSIAKTMDSSKTKSCIGASHGKISRGAVSTSQDKGKGYKRSHSARYLH